MSISVFVQSTRRAMLTGVVPRSRIRPPHRLGPVGISMTIDLFQRLILSSDHLIASFPRLQMMSTNNIATYQKM